MIFGDLELFGWKGFVNQIGDLFEGQVDRFCLWFKDPVPEREICFIAIENSLDLQAAGIAEAQVIGDREQRYGRERMATVFFNLSFCEMARQVALPQCLFGYF